MSASRPCLLGTSGFRYPRSNPYPYPCPDPDQAVPVRHVQPLDDRADGEHVHRELPVADDHRTLMAAVAAAAQAGRVGVGPSLLLRRWGGRLHRLQLSLATLGTGLGPDAPACLLVSST
jgi:hypothetical protein